MLAQAIQTGITESFKCNKRTLLYCKNCVEKWNVPFKFAIKAINPPDLLLLSAYRVMCTTAAHGMQGPVCKPNHCE